MRDRSLSRRDALKLGLGAGALLTLGCRPTGVETGAAPVRMAGDSSLILRPIPSSGERLPVVGIGTARRYESASTEAELAPLRETLRKFPELGGKVIDTAPGYGNAEVLVGTLLAELGNRSRYFVATKVSARNGDVAAAAQQMEESMKRLRIDRIDLMQIWNVSSPDQLFPLLQEWKAAKRIRYTGITTSSDRQYEQLEALMKKYPFDFVQVDYAIDNRGAAERILPLAADRGQGVLINLPFGRTRVFQKVQGRPLPDWAKEIDATSWAQIFLKYIVSHPSVTVVIPGTAKPEYAVDNAGAAHGRLPDAASRKRIESYFDAIAE